MPINLNSEIIYSFFSLEGARGLNTMQVRLSSSISISNKFNGSTRMQMKVETQKERSHLIPNPI